MDAVGLNGSVITPCTLTHWG